MAHEADISGRLENLGEPTVFAIGGITYSFAVLLSSIEKHRLMKLIEIEELAYHRATKKKMRKQADRYQRIFSIMLFYLISCCPNDMGMVVLDRDYDKKRMRQAKKTVLSLMKAKKLKKNLTLIVGSAGKGAAHDVAIETYRGVRKATIVLSAEDVMVYYSGNKKATKKGG